MQEGRQSADHGGGCAGFVRRAPAGLAPEPAQALRQILALDLGDSFRAVRGRATLPWPGDPSVIVKRYERGVWRDAWFDWRSRGRVRSFAQREAENLDELRELGIAAPRALGWCGRAGWPGVGAPSALWMERVEHTEDLRTRLEREPSEARRWCDELARLTARLHAADWRHRDLYMQHILLGSHGLVLIDVGRCERERGMRLRWFVKDLAALEMSCPAAVPARERLRFAARYFRERGSHSRAEKRSMLRSALAKARRMAAHTPRYVDPRESRSRAGGAP